MENASKALVMAGSVLLAIMIISLAIWGYNQMKQTPREQEESKRIEQITDYNRQYESYNQKKVSGADILSLANKIISNNAKYQEIDNSYIMTMQVTIKTKTTNNKFSGTMNHTQLEAISNTYKNGKENVDSATKEDITEFKRKIFKCTGTEYNGEILKKMTFVEVVIPSTIG